MAFLELEVKTNSTEDECLFQLRFPPAGLGSRDGIVVLEPLLSFLSLANSFLSSLCRAPWEKIEHVY